MGSPLMLVEVHCAVKSLLYEGQFPLGWQPRRRLFQYRSVPPMSLTTAMGSVLVGDATSDFRGFRILGRHPLIYST